MRSASDIGVGGNSFIHYTRYIYYNIICKQVPEIMYMRFTLFVNFSCFLFPLYIPLMYIPHSVFTGIMTNDNSLNWTYLWRWLSKKDHFVHVIQQWIFHTAIKWCTVGVGMLPTAVTLQKKFYVGIPWLISEENQPERTNDQGFNC